MDNKSYLFTWALDFIPVLHCFIRKKQWNMVNSTL